MTGAILGALSLLGTGVMFYSSMQSANSSDAIAAANAASSLQAAKNQGLMGQAQANLEAIKAKKEQEAAYANADGMRQQSEAEARAAGVNIQRHHQDFAAQLAASRAAIARKGVIDSTGSPLNLLVNQAELNQLQEHEMRYSAEIGLREGYRSAAIEQTRGKVAGLDVGMAYLRGAAAQNQAQMAGTQARMDLLSAQAANSGTRLGAWGGLIGGVANGLSQFRSYRYSAPGAASTTVRRALDPMTHQPFAYNPILR